MIRKDLDLLRKSMLSLKKGNIDSLDTIYELTRKGVFSFVYPIMKTRENTEDLVQQVYIQLFEKIDQYDKKKNPLNWILTMAKNLALTEVTRENKEICTDFLEPLNGDRLVVNDKIEVDTPAFTTAKEVLKEDELQIVLLFAVAEYKHREIAELLKLPIGTVTWKYNTAIKKVRQALENKGITE